MRRSTVALVVAVPLLLVTLACGTAGQTAGHQTGNGAAGPGGSAGTGASTVADKTQTFSGSSDKLIKLSGLSGSRLHVARMTYKGSSNFIVDAVDGSGQELNNLANAIGRYTGDVAIELGEIDSTNQMPAGIKVQAQGSWTIQILDIAAMPSLQRTSTTGRGAAVLVVPTGLLGGLSTFTFVHNGSENFIVDAYGDSSGSTNLVNEIGHFDGQELVPSDTRVITIEADGTWTITAS
jgi:hypothetical protein